MVASQWQTRILIKLNKSTVSILKVIKHPIMQKWVKLDRCQHPRSKDRLKVKDIHWHLLRMKTSRLRDQVQYHQGRGLTPGMTDHEAARTKWSANNQNKSIKWFPMYSTMMTWLTTKTQIAFSPTSFAIEHLVIPIRTMNDRKLWWEAMFNLKDRNRKIKNTWMLKHRLTRIMGRKLKSFSTVST